MNKFISNNDLGIDYNDENKNVNEDVVYIKRRKMNGYSNNLCFDNAKLDSRILVLMMGFCFGMIFFFISEGNTTNSQVFLQIFEQNIENFFINKSNLLMYILEIRIRQLLLLVICATSIINTFIMYIILGAMGLGIGIITFTMIYQYGIMGAFFLLILIFPHGILYVLILLRIIKRSCLNKHSFQEIHNYNKIKRIRMVFNEAIAIMILFVIGILTEVYINAELVKKLIIML